MIDSVEDDLIESLVNSAEEMIVRSNTYTGYMRAERPLIDRALPAVEYSVHNAAETSVLMRMNDSDTAIMIPADEEILAAQVCRKMISSHTANVDLVDSIQITWWADLENDNAFIRDRIQILAVSGYCQIRRIVALNDLAKVKQAFRYVYVINMDTLALSVSVGADICDIILCCSHCFLLSNVIFDCLNYFGDCVPF
jgi:hypothetical protein